MLSLCAASCVDDYEGQGSSDSKDKQDEKPDIATIVNSCSSCSSSYVDYHVNITIDHTILSKLPNAQLTYVVGHAERGSSTCQVISGGNYTIIPTVTTTGNRTSVKIKFPFYYYFMAKRAEATSYVDKEYYSNATVDCEMYLASYMALKDKSNMSASERDLYNAVKRYLNDYQNEVRGSYTVWVYISIDGKNYLVKSINI